MNYWAKTAEEVVKELVSSEAGLDEEKVNVRLGEYGLNDIPVRKEKSAASLLLSQVKDLLIKH